MRWATLFLHILSAIMLYFTTAQKRWAGQPWTEIAETEPK
jgi:hypothetical protein